MEEQGSNETTADAAYETAKASRFHFKYGSKYRSKREISTDGEASERSSRRHQSEIYYGDRHIERDSRRRHKNKRDISADGEASERSSQHHQSERYYGDRHSERDSRRRHKQKYRSSHSDRHPTSTVNGAYYDPDSRHRESLFDDINADINANTTAYAGLSPGDVFRDSLFDALADDEGAAYWEGVYGQPMHIYPDTKPGRNGTLERMSEEEYADHVRTKMWEKSHQHIVQEREAKEQARRKHRERRRYLDEDFERDEAERETIRWRMEESLRRGEERKRAKEGEAAWNIYTTKWEALKNTPHHSVDKDINVRELIPWPVVSGKAKHVTKNEMEWFFKGSQAWRKDEMAVLKIERVRWHPDKIQQRFGQHVDAATMKLVTAVFQVVDRLWSDRR